MNRRVPDPSYWGLSYYGNGHWSFGGSEKSFAWFRSFEEMLDWIEQWLHFHPSGPTNVDNLSKNSYENVLPQVSKVTGEWRANPTQIQAALDQLNLTLKDRAVCK